ncbi:hypothetical protein Taro_036267 [Colocasia esculenta]|uniref:ZCF37 n=1 Tax=Colocasia esculenta TaxID=4460 RepID=A0A843W988_COLES|nr:hypothetical protein [Colocasia esculenta]
MFCGAGSFAHVDEDSPRSPPTPRGSRRKQGGDNPYASRGLPEFSMVLADLESRREKIMAKAGSQGVAFVRFVYSNSQDWVPIIVRRREGRPAEPEEMAEEGGGEEAHKKPDATDGHRAPPPPRPAEQAGKEAAKKTPLPEEEVGRRGGLLQLFRWRDSYYWPAVAVLILLSLALSGRVFAICCTSMWWYLVPAMRAGEGGRTAKKPAVKRHYTRRVSDRRLGGGAGDEGAAGKRGADPSCSLACSEANASRYVDEGWGEEEIDLVKVNVVGQSQHMTRSIRIADRVTPNAQRI